MKLLGSVLVLWTLVGVISGATINKRGQGMGLPGVAVPAATAYPPIPSLINQLTSGLFTPNATTGETPIYGLLKQLTSNIYPSLANTTYSLLKPLNNLINQITSNLYNGLCAPPVPNYPTGQTPTAGGWPTAAPTSPATAPNAITNILNLLTGNSGASGSDLISQLLAGLTGLTGTVAGLFPGVTVSGNVNTTLNLSPQALTALLTPIGQSLQSLQAALNTLGWSAQQFVNGLATSGGNIAAYLQNIFAQAAQAGLASLFPGVTVTGGVNTTLNVSPQALATVLSSIGQTLQSLQAALAKLGWGAQQFVNGLAGFGGNIAAYLQNIFSQAASAGTTSGLGGLFPGATVTGSVNLTLNLSPQAFMQQLANIQQTVPSLQTALNTLSATAQQFVDGLAAYQGNVANYLQAIFNQANTPSTGGAGTNTLQGLLNNVLNSLNSALGGTGVIPTLNDLLTSLLGALGLGK